MSRRRIRLLILTGLLSIGGTLVLQLLWVRQAYDLNERQFNDRVVVALTEVVEEIQWMRGDLAVVDPVIQLASNYFVANINDTLHPFLLETLLEQAFAAVNLDQAIEYGIYDCFSDSIVYGGRLGADVVVAGGPSKAALPRFDRDGHYFGILFPEKTAGIVMSLKRWLLASILQLLVLGTFVYAVVLVLRQKRLSEVRDDFIANMTHEFKTPIATIEAAVRLLERDEVDGDASLRAKYRDLIGGENQRMRRQVDRVMEISTLDGGGNSDLKLERLDLLDIVRDAVGATEIFARDAEGEIRFDCKLAHAPVIADRVHLTNVLCNLLDNAVRYAEKSPRIAVELHIKNSPGEQGVWSVVVRDNGIGIPTEHLGRIFDRFFRVPTGDRHDVKGFGLGLHYVKSMVEAHGGTIRCESKPGFGSTFTVKLQKAPDA